MSHWLVLVVSYYWCPLIQCGILLGIQLLQNLGTIAFSNTNSRTMDKEAWQTIVTILAGNGAIVVKIHPNDNVLQEVFKNYLSIGLFKIEIR